MRFTPRMKAYTAILVLLLGIEVALLATRSDLDATVLRASGQMYQLQPNNRISNLYTIKIINKTREQFPVSLKLESAEGEVKVVGKEMRVQSEGIETGEFFIILDKEKIVQRKTKVQLGLYSGNRKIKTVKTNFFSPFSTKN